MIRRKSAAIFLQRKRTELPLAKTKNGCTFHIQKCCGNGVADTFALFGEYSDL